MLASWCKSLTSSPCREVCVFSKMRFRWNRVVCRLMWRVSLLPSATHRRRVQLQPGSRRRQPEQRRHTFLREIAPTLEIRDEDARRRVQSGLRMDVGGGWAYDQQPGATPGWSRHLHARGTATQPSSPASQRVANCAAHRCLLSGGRGAKHAASGVETVALQRGRHRPRHWLRGSCHPWRSTALRRSGHWLPLPAWRSVHRLW